MLENRVRLGLVALSCLLTIGCATASPAPQSVRGTWTANNQAFAFCDGGSLLVLDPAMKDTWCEGTYQPDGAFSVNCADSSPGGAHTSAGTCSLSSETLSCPYSAAGGSYTFVGTRSEHDACTK
jgi:hypothetical protein